MAGQRQKHPDALVFRRGDRVKELAPVSGWSGPVPGLPDSIQNEFVRGVWDDLWASSLAGAFKPTDVPTLVRWAWWFEQWLRAAKEVAENDIAPPGVMQQAVLNPTIRYLKTCEASLRELEKAFGMDALSRLRLGITLADGASKAQALKQPAQAREM